MQKRPKSTVDLELEEIQNKAKKPGKTLMKNITVASALVIGVVALRCGAIPELNQATDIVVSVLNTDLLDDDRLGKLSFVSAMFPEAALVFGEQSDIGLFQNADVIHAWSEAEPFLLVKNEHAAVASFNDGQVLDVRRESDGTWTVSIGDQQHNAVYGNLQSVSVREGDRVAKADEIGHAAAGQSIAVEMRSNGISIDPAQWQVSMR